MDASTALTVLLGCAGLSLLTIACAAVLHVLHSPCNAKLQVLRAEMEALEGKLYKRYYKHAVRGGEDEPTAPAPAVPVSPTDEAPAPADRAARLRALRARIAAGGRRA